MSGMDERRHVARRLAERDVAIDLESYGQESVSGQGLIDKYDERARPSASRRSTLSGSTGKRRSGPSLMSSGHGCWPASMRSSLGGCAGALSRDTHRLRG